MTWAKFQAQDKFSTTIEYHVPHFRRLKVISSTPPRIAAVLQRLSHVAERPFCHLLRRRAKAQASKIRATSPQKAVMKQTFFTFSKIIPHEWPKVSRRLSKIRIVTFLVLGWMRFAFE